MVKTEKGKLWGGRFEGGPDEAFRRFDCSFGFDRRLLPYELAVDKVWARALVDVGILTREEAEQTSGALDEIGRRIRTEPGWLDQVEAEDLHGFVEAALVEKLGPVGAKLHTGRSRSDLVVTDFRLFVKDAALAVREQVVGLVGALAGQAEKYFGVPVAGMTHLQHAQPILFSHFLLSHAEAFQRDAERLEASADRADACPLGAGAIAGSTLAIDRAKLARDMGFRRVTANSIDAVGDRDFALEYLFALSVLALHLSRLAEDFILLATSEFGYLILSDAFSTGSSMMPQKKNPDAWELIRGKSGRVVGALVSLLVTLKGLPAGYQRDLQEDKEPLFDAHDQMLAAAEVAAGAVAATGVDAERMRKSAADPALLATEAADYLAGRGVPFRQAHEIVGALVKEGERRGQAWNQLPLDVMRQFSPAFEPDWHRAVTLEAALDRRSLAGGTAPAAVRKGLENCRAWLQKQAPAKNEQGEPAGA
ncbi:MAG TPA: argininosuccinate lyase [Candidatus Dormibacteraeota bacterium]|nr:argininosuccinate lyase [Candidatus Dormibacteraeota bacterium]